MNKIKRTCPLLIALFTLLPGLPAAAQSPHTHQHSFGDAEKWSQIFDDPKRDEWQKPHEVIQALTLKPDAVIADIGSGTGYFSARFANMVPKGRVYGVDTEPDMVKYLDRAGEARGTEEYFRGAGNPGQSPTAGESGSGVPGRCLPPHRGSRALFPEACRLAQARRPDRRHRFPHGFSGWPAEKCAHCARPGEGRTQARRLCPDPGARLPAEPVFPDLPPKQVLKPGEQRCLWSLCATVMSRISTEAVKPPRGSNS